VLRVARGAHDVLVVGVDANGERLHEAARRAGRKSARGGAGNALFGRLALEQAPGELVGLADRLTIYFPWGSLLAAVAGPDPEALARLTAITRPGAELELVFGYDAAIDGLTLPPLDPPALAARYGEAGLTVAARWLPLRDLRALPTTWAGKLAFGRPRPFVELRGRTR
jgi:hypothetical protein